MKAPIFVYEPNDLGVFESLSAAELKIESIDVRENAFSYYDAAGQVLAASIHRDNNGIEKTVIHETPEKRHDPEKLRSLIADFLIAMGFSKFEVGELQLEELVERSLEFKTQ